MPQETFWNYKLVFQTKNSVDELRGIMVTLETQIW